METVKGLATLVAWAALLYAAYKILDVTGMGNLIVNLLEWLAPSQPDSAPDGYSPY